MLLFVIVFYFGSGPIRVLLYTPPAHEILSYSSGTATVVKVYKGGEYISLI
jgi:hypothetical protein